MHLTDHLAIEALDEALQAAERTIHAAAGTGNYGAQELQDALSEVARRLLTQRVLSSRSELDDLVDGSIISTISRVDTVRRAPAIWRREHEQWASLTDPASVPVETHQLPSVGFLLLHRPAWLGGQR